MFNRTQSLRQRRHGLWLAYCFLALPFIGASAAEAEDLAMPVKASPTLVYNWSGCYGGVNAGGGTAGSNFGTAVDPGTYLVGGDLATVAGSGAGSKNDIGFIGGGQAGCNWQSGTLVVGIEGDFDWFRSNPSFNNDTNTLANGASFAVAQSLTTNYLATVRPRIGIAADRNFAYITGGVGLTSISYTETYSDTSAAPGPGAGTASASKFLVGWTAGAGWEHALADRWTFRVEYLVAGFPTTNATGAILAPGGLTNTLHGSADLLVQLLRAGINFKF